MKKSIVVIIITVFLLSLFSGAAIASTSGDENYNDHSKEFAQGEQPDPDEISGMKRVEDRTRNKDL